MNTPNTQVKLDAQSLIEAYDARYPDDTADSDMRGKRISSARVLLSGAYRPCTLRVLALVAAESKTPITRTRLAQLVSEAATQAADVDFGGNLMTNFDIMTLEPHGFGLILLRLAELVQEDASEGV